MAGFKTVELTRRFERSYAGLPPDIQRRVDRAIRTLLADSSYPSLRYKPIQPAKLYYEASVSMQYRIVVLPAGSHLTLIDVGPHAVIGKYA